jgi:ribonuclease HI
MANKLIIHTDGGARGNPGPAAIGIVIDSPTGKKVYSEFIGETTNNVAEYQAVIFALKKAKQFLGKTRASETEIDIFTDSELMYKQIAGLYKIKNSGIQPLFITVWNLKQDFKKVNFKYIPREQNKEADKLVNKALDRLDI